MKKVIAIVICLVLVPGIFTGCGEKEQESKHTGSGLTAEEILDSFEGWMADTEMVNDYTVTRLPGVELPDTGETYHAIVVKDNLLDYSYHMSVYATPEGKAYRASINHNADGYGYLAFSTFCLYLVRSIGLTEVDGFELCDQLGLMSMEPEGMVTVEGWELWAFHFNGSLSFTATYKPES